MSTPTSSPDRMRLAHPLVVNERIKRMIAGAVAEIDPAQIAILRTFTPAQRFQQMISMIQCVESVGAFRLRVREPELSEAEALQIVRSGTLIKRALEKRWQRSK